MARRQEQIKMAKRKKRGTIEPVDPMFLRVKLLDPKIKMKIMNGQTEVVENYAHEVIDEIYDEVRVAVVQEIKQIDDLFLIEAANQNKTPGEMELTNLLCDKEEAEKRAAVKKDVQMFLERTKQEYYAAMSQND